MNNKKVSIGIIISILFIGFIFFSNPIWLNAQEDKTSETLNIRENISEEEIRNFFKEVELACNQMNIASYSQTLSDDFKMTALIGNQKIEFSRGEYIKNLRDGWALNKDYNYTFEILNIQLKKTEAIVEGRETEKIIFKTGESFSGESVHKITLEKKNKLIKQKFIYATVTEIH